MPIPLAIPAIVAGANIIGKFISGAKQTKESKAINPIWQQYQTNPFARKQLEVAQNMFADPSMGTRAGFQRNIMSNFGNTASYADNNISDGSQGLAYKAGLFGQANEAISNENMNFMQNKANMLGNLNQAYGTMIGEGDKEYQSMLQKYGMDVERKDALRQSGAANKYGAVSDLASMGFSLAGSGGFGNIFGGGGKAPKQFGGSGLDPTRYGFSVFNQLTNRPKLNQ